MRSHAIIFMFLLFFSYTAINLPAGEAVDILIQGGTIHDGSGKECFVGDVAVKGERIAAVGDLDGVTSTQVIDARGRIVCPGFIDLHTHCDKGVTEESLGENLNYLTQGVTTVVTGNCGGGRIDVAAYFDLIEKQGAGTNVIHLVPQGTVRRKVMEGSFDRPPTPEETAKMKGLIKQGMEAGAFGMSTGLFYAPGAYSTKDEIVTLARVAAEYGGIYASHIRSEEYGFLGALEEAIEIGRLSGCPVQISHFKAAMKPIATVMRPLDTVDVDTKAADKAFRERSDVCAVPAAGVVGEQMVAFVLANEITRQFGGDTVVDLQTNVAAYRQRLERF